jgi:hypothetical protein
VVEVDMATYAERVAEAIKCENWQEFRVSLKGQSTYDKLMHLRSYLMNLRVDPIECCDFDTRSLQVYNYLGALSRGGLIEPGATIEQLQGERIQVRR